MKHNSYASAYALVWSSTGRVLRQVGIRYMGNYTQGISSVPPGFSTSAVQ